MKRIGFLKMVTMLVLCICMVIGTVPEYKNVYAVQTLNATKTKKKATGSANDPIPVGETYVMKGTSDYIGDRLSGTYGFRVNSSKTLSAKKAKALGQTQVDKYTYKLVNVTLAAKNVKIKKVDGQGYIFKSLIKDEVEINGAESKTTYVIGVDDYSFEGSLDKQWREKVGYAKLYPGKTCNVTATGNVLVAIPKGQSANLVIRNQFIEDYESSKIRFKLK